MGEKAEDSHQALLALGRERCPSGIAEAAAIGSGLCAAASAEENTARSGSERPTTRSTQTAIAYSLSTKLKGASAPRPGDGGSRGSSPTKWLRSFAMEATTSGSLLWRVGACQCRRSLAALRSPTFATSAARMARLARQEKPLHRARDFVLRARRYQAAQDAEMVRAQPRSTLVRVRWSMDPLARRARAKERARR